MMELDEENRLLKNSLNNLNMFCDSLIQSNKILTLHLTDFEKVVNSKFELVTKFLIKNGFTVEDLEEFGNEQLIPDVKKRRKKKNDEN